MENEALCLHSNFYPVGGFRQPQLQDIAPGEDFTPTAIEPVDPARTVPPKSNAPDRPLFGDQTIPGQSSDIPFTAARERMLTEQLAAPGRGIPQDIVDAMAKVARHQFVRSEWLGDSYQDKTLPIGYDRTIESPYVTASVAQQLNAQTLERVLEIGTGSGYQTAVLSHLAKEVYSIEPIPQLAQVASVDLRRLGYTNVFVRSSDPRQGWPEAGPFDALIFNSPDYEITDALLVQLKPNGRVIVAVDNEGNQHVLHKSGNQLIQQSARLVRPTPVTGNKVILGPILRIQQQQ